MVGKPNKIYILALYAAVATILQLRIPPVAEKSFFVGNEAACAASTGGAAKNGAAPVLVYTMWAVACRHDIAFWTERAPPKFNPADLPSGGR